MIQDGRTSDIGRSTGSYILFYKVGPIDYCTHVPGPVAQYNAESEYNAACTVGISLAHFNMLNNEWFNSDPDAVLEQAPLIILGRKSVICMAKNRKETKHTRYISRFFLMVNSALCTRHCGIREV